MISGPASAPGDCGIFEKAFLVSLGVFWEFAPNRSAGLSGPAALPRGFATAGLG